MFGGNAFGWAYPGEAYAGDASSSVAPAGIASGEAFGVPIIAGVISPTGIASGEAFGATVVNTRFVIPAGIASAGALGTPKLNLRITATGIASAGAVGVPSLGKFIAGAGGIASAEDLGTKSKFRRGHLIQNGGTGTLQLVLPIMLDTSEAFGRLAVGTNVVGAGNIPSGGAVGTPTVVGLPTITMAGIASAEAFGSPVVASPTVTQAVSPSAIASGESFGSPTLALVVPSLLSPAAIASAAAFGASRVRLATAVAASPELDVLTDLVSGERYVFPVSHTGEDPVSEQRQVTYGAPAAGVTVARQQSPGGDLVLRLAGTILTQAQYDKLVDFNARCENRTLIYTDFAGDEYEVLITNFDARATRAVRNPAEPALQYVWTYTLELHVIAVRAGAYAA